MSNTPFYRPFLLALLSASVVAFSSHSLLAHTVWLEQKDGQLVVRFAEPGNKFETSPGYLDSLAPLNAFILVTNAPTVVEAPKKSDHFLLVGASPTNVACVETVFTVRGGRKPYFYARWQSNLSNAATPMLNLDLVPTGKAGEVRAWFRGNPLGGAKAILYTPDEKETEIMADADGFLHVETKRPGQYRLAIAHYREPLAGFFNGQSYKETSHNSALSWTQP